MLVTLWADTVVCLCERHLTTTTIRSKDNLHHFPLFLDGIYMHTSCRIRKIFWNIVNPYGQTIYRKRLYSHNETGGDECSILHCKIEHMYYFAKKIRPQWGVHLRLRQRVGGFSFSSVWHRICSFWRGGSFAVSPLS